MPDNRITKFRQKNVQLSFFLAMLLCFVHDYVPLIWRLYIFAVFVGFPENIDTFILAWAQHRPWRAIFFLPS